MKPIPTLPEFLNSGAKWYKIVKETDTVEKIKNILYTILDDDNISTLDTFKIMKQLEGDIRQDLFYLLDYITLSKIFQISDHKKKKKYIYIW